MKNLVYVLLITLLSLMGCQSAHNVKPDLFPQTSIAPSIQLTTADGMGYKLSDIYGEHTGTVVVFWQSKCPCVKRYQDRVSQLFNRYGQDNIAMLYVSSNTDESFETALAEYQKRNSPLPLMRDEGGQLAKLINAKGTPTAALFNQAGDLIYLGWIDNERYENESGRIAYLEDAIKDLVAKRPVSVPTSSMFGCPIK